MRGQWHGHVEGEVPGYVILDLDERGDRYTGTALFIPDDQEVPSTVAFVDTQSKADNCQFEAYVYSVREHDRRLLSPEELAHEYPEIVHDKTAKISIARSDEGLITSYATSVSSATGLLRQRKTELESTYQTEQALSWHEFKAEIGSIRAEEFVWRGQSQPWSLQTSFHRTGRVDLHRYVFEDIPRLQASLLPHTRAFFDVSSPTLSGGLYSLAQHYGYPTPLLDWTYSPYVAAFFAYRRAEESERIPRVFAFNRARWPMSCGTMTHVAHARPHVTIMDLPPLENERALPQQAVAMVTNVANIEAFIAAEEQAREQRYLLAFDLRPSDRSEALRDLRLMGITAASMFPGLDGTCEHLKHMCFEAG